MDIIRRNPSSSAVQLAFPPASGVLLEDENDIVHVEAQLLLTGALVRVQRLALGTVGRAAGLRECSPATLSWLLLLLLLIATHLPLLLLLLLLVSAHLLLLLIATHLLLLLLLLTLIASCCAAAAATHRSLLLLVSCTLSVAAAAAAARLSVASGRSVGARWQL